MEALAVQLGLVAGVLAAFVVGPGLALAFLLVRKARRQSLRRTPLGIHLLRSPGYTLRVEVEEVLNDLTWDILALAVFPLIFLSLFLAQANLRGWSQSTHAIPLYVLVTVATIAVVIAKMLKRGAKLDRLRAGYDAELAVGQELDQLMRSGAYVFHDVPGDNFNIDHVVVSTEGLFAIETKGYTKLTGLRGREGARVVYDGRELRFPTWTTAKPVEQSARQAKWLASLLSKAVGERVDATSVLALPGWFVERRGDGEVLVFSGKQLGHELLRQPGRRLSNSLVDRIAHQLDQRCRTVEPTFGPSKARA